jgi:hypothetical protein
MKTLNKLTKGELRFMVKMVWGMGNGRSSIKAGEMLNDQDLKLIYEHLQYQYQQSEVRMADATVVTLALAEGIATDVGLEAILCLRQMLSESEVMIIPIHADMHWTFIEICTAKAGDMEVIEVNYYDWLIDIRSNRRQAMMLWALLTDGKEAPLPATKNQYRQSAGTNDCGLCGWWILEQRMKERRGEGKGSLYPDPKRYRATLHTLCIKLTKEKENWILEEADKKKPSCMITLPGNVEEDMKLQRKKLLDAIKAGTVIAAKSKFYACSSCRWKEDGEGCLYCNPKQAEKVIEEKKIRQNAVKRAIDIARAAAQNTMATMELDLDLGVVPPSNVEPSLLMQHALVELTYEHMKLPSAKGVDEVLEGGGDLRAG